MLLLLLGPARILKHRLAWAHRERTRHELLAPLPYSRRERAKPLEGRVAVVHFGCCVLCVVCCGLWVCKQNIVM